MENLLKLLILVNCLLNITCDVRKQDGPVNRKQEAATNHDKENFHHRDRNSRLMNGRKELISSHHRSNDENRSDFVRGAKGATAGGASASSSSGSNEETEEAEYRRAVKDGLRSKIKRKDENFDAFNMRTLNGDEHDDTKRSTNWNPLRPEVLYTEQKKMHLRDNIEDITANGRQRKTKKHGPGFIPLPPPKERKPNIILILTDDQDVELGSLNFMPHTLRLLRDGGAEFRHAYVTTPMCCPSRSSLLTGLYVHNHHVFTNNENCSNIHWQQTHETRTFATYLSNAGYRTGYFGKYLNKYNGTYIPPGWREWGGLIMNSRYYNYSINLNGKKIKHGASYSKDYYTDLIANDSVAFLRQSKQYFSRKPVMLVLSFPAPHGPEDSAPQFSNMFYNVTTHHTPAYDFAPNPDKQWILQVTNKMQSIHKQFTDMLMTKRLQTLQSVDIAVERIYQELKNIGELDNTYMIYTSDHGYHLGQFGLVKGKSFPFEFDVRVPFLVRGPGVDPGTVVDEVVLNIDLAPTFLDIAGVDTPPHMDGRSILRLLHHHSANGKRRKLRWPDTFLIESSGRRDVPPDGREAAKTRPKPRGRGDTATTEDGGVGSTVYTTEGYGTSEGVTGRDGVTESEEAMDSDVDEDLDDEEDDDEDEETQEDNRDDVPSLLDQLQFPVLGRDSQVDNKLSPLSHAVPKLARLAIECQLPELQSPCRSGQKWHCVLDGSRWRKHKCKFQRKCACFTPNGLVYTKLDSGERRSVNLNSHNKRAVNFALPWDMVSQHVDRGTLLALITRSDRVRRKRDTSEDHITAVLEDLEEELTEIEERGLSLNATFNLGSEPGMSRCSVTALGQVNCSSIVYTDVKVWRESRESVDARIRELKNQLEALKEIRKHLRVRRPVGQPQWQGGNVTNNASLAGRVPASSAPDNIAPIIAFTDGTSQSVTERDQAMTTPQVIYDDDLYVTSVINNGSDAATNVEPAESTTVGREVTTTGPGGEDGSINRIDGSLVGVSRGRDRCVCTSDGRATSFTKKEEKELTKEARKRLREERLKKRERKLRKKSKMDKDCVSEKMNCFNHDNEHWRTPPLWTEGPFCFCMNANNNTYSCTRTINSTHNFLYCEFITGFRTFYNLRIDPFEQLNRVSSLSKAELTELSNQLEELKACKEPPWVTTDSGQSTLVFIVSAICNATDDVRLGYGRNVWKYVQLHDAAYKPRISCHPRGTLTTVPDVLLVAEVSDL